MLSGEFQHSIDAKNRIFVPAKMREELGESFVVMCDPHVACLKFYSLAGWEEYLQPIRNPEIPRRKRDDMIRLLHSDLSTVTPDSQGRIVLTQAQIARAGITKGAVVIGCYDCAEVWSQEAYDERFGKKDFEQLSRDLDEFGL